MLIFSEPAAALMKPICDSPTASSVAMIPTEEKWLACATWSTVASTAAPAGATWNAFDERGGLRRFVEARNRLLVSDGSAALMLAMTDSASTIGAPANLDAHWAAPLTVLCVSHSSSFTGRPPIPPALLSACRDG